MEAEFIGSGHVELGKTTRAAKAMVGVCLEKQLNTWPGSQSSPGQSGQGHTVSHFCILSFPVLCVVVVLPQNPVLHISHSQDAAVRTLTARHTQPH